MNLAEGLKRELLDIADILEDYRGSTQHFFAIVYRGTTVEVRDVRREDPRYQRPENPRWRLTWRGFDITYYATKNEVVGRINQVDFFREEK